MKTALVVMSYKNQEETVLRHLPFWKASGADCLIGDAPNDGTVWPDGFNMGLVNGKSQHAGEEIINRVVQLMEVLPRLGFDRYCLIEYDVLILRPIEWGGPGFRSEISESVDSHFKSRFFYLPPWIMDGQTMKELAVIGRQMLAEGNIEGGFVDRFMGVATDRLGIQVRRVLGGIFTRDFRLEPPEAYKLGRGLAMGNKVTYLHTVKTQHELEYLTGQRDDIPPQRLD